MVLGLQPCFRGPYSKPRLWPALGAGSVSISCLPSPTTDDHPPKTELIISPVPPFTVTEGTHSPCAGAVGLYPHPPHPAGNGLPASTHRCSLCSFLLPFSPQLGFPGRWLKAQPNLFIHSSMKHRGAELSEDLGHPFGRVLLAPHWALPECKHTDCPKECPAAVLWGLQVGSGTKGKALPCAVATEALAGREGARPVSQPQCGLPSGPPRTDLPSCSPTLPSGPSH